MHLVVGLARKHQRQEDVILDSEVVQQVELLKNEAEIVASELCYLGFPDACKLLAVEQHRAARCFVESRKDIQQGGLAGAGLAHDGDVLALINAEVDIFQSLDRIRAKACFVDLFDSLYFE